VFKNGFASQTEPSSQWIQDETEPPAFLTEFDFPVERSDQHGSIGAAGHRMDALIHFLCLHALKEHCAPWFGIRWAFFALDPDHKPSGMGGTLLPLGREREAEPR
jgi:hypothetical protein